MRITLALACVAPLFALACQPRPPGAKSVEHGNAARVGDETSDAAPPTPAADPFASIPRISVEELAQALKEGGVVIVDVRPAEAFAAEHIRGAVSMPEEEVSARAAELPRDKLIVAYCA